MTSATKTLSLIFAVLLAVSVITGLFGGQTSSDLFTKDLTVFEPDQVDRIEIRKPDDEEVIELYKEGGNWMVRTESGDQTYPANGSLADQTVNQFAGLNVKSVVTRDPEKFTRFRVDTTGTEITFLEGEAELDRIIVGSPQILSQSEFNTYIRPADRQEVFSVEGFLNASVNRELDDWRDKTVWNLGQNSITEIEFEYPADSSFVITRAEENGWVSGPDSLDQSQTSRLLRQVASLNANGFVDDTTVTEFGEPLYTLHIRTDGGSEHTLQIKPSFEDENRYEATASGFPYVFTVLKSTWDSSVLRSRGEFLQ